MTELAIVYRTKRGEEKTPLRTDTTELILSGRQILSIDLRPLAACRDLRVIDLSTNLISTIDLWPLMRCPSLDRLALRGNRLGRLDVTPLFYCPRLSNIEVDDIVKIEANYDTVVSRPRPQPLDELRRHRPVKWTTDGDNNPLVEIERLKNEVFTALSKTYPSPDNAQIVDQLLTFELCDRIERMLTREIEEAERAGDFRRMSVLQRGLDYVKRGMSA
ncbi:MAG: leucine-rich repeat domain-containing protein [Candidatus Thorarchaeota archaeon]|nr:leucine-rich repeat domain-containing protein [Candidatus Thorarchaeota archaeon]